MKITFRNASAQSQEPASSEAKAGQTKKADKFTRLKERLGSAGHMVSAPRTGFPFDRLPDELKLQVLKHAAPDDLKRLAETSQEMNDLVQSTPELRRPVTAMVRAAEDLRAAPGPLSVAADLDKLRLAAPLLQEELRLLARRTGKDLVVSEPYMNHATVTQNLAALSGALIGTGKLGKGGDRALAYAVAHATPEPFGLSKRTQRSVLMGAALANVASDDPARYKPLTQRLGLRLDAYPQTDDDIAALEKLPPSVQQKVDLHRGD